MDQTLIGILIGAGVSIVTTLSTQWLTMAKEDKQWNRERQSKLDDQKELDAKEQNGLLRQAYIKCVHNLSYLESKINRSEFILFSEKEEKLTI